MDKADIARSPKTADARSNGVGHYRWVICALLFFATTINYIDRQTLSLLKPALDRQFGWDYKQFGWINAFFQGAYGAGLWAFGWFADVYGVKIAYAVSIVAWSFAAMAQGIAVNTPTFTLARVCLGLGEGGNFPAAIKTVAQWFPQTERAWATALFNAGTNVGPILAPGIILWLSSSFGWRSAFIATGALGLLWVVFWLRLYYSPATHPSANPSALAEHRAAEDRAVNKISWRELLKYPQTWSFIVAKFLTDPVWWFFLIWLPDFFKQTRGLDLKQSWAHLVTIYTIITALSVIGGWVVGFLASLGWTISRARKTAMFFFALCVTPVYLVTKSGPWGAVALIGLAGAAHQAWSANLFTTVSDMFPKSAVASVVGLGGLSGSVGAMIFPILTGQLLDHFKANPAAGYAILFSVCAFAYLPAFALNHLLAPEFEMITTPPRSS
jgi:ACS family hexuronate transporter-like MFS transporter